MTKSNSKASLYSEYERTCNNYNTKELPEGFVVYKFLKDSKEMHIKNLFVKADARRQGIGSELLEYVEGVAIQCGAVILHLSLSTIQQFPTPGLMFATNNGLEITKSDSCSLLLSKLLKQPQLNS